MNSKLKIYFAGSIRGGRGDTNLYAQIINFLKESGEVLTEHISNSSLSNQGENLNEKFIHDRDISWLRETDILIAECTTPSLGVGYEVGRALEWDKPMLCLYRIKEGKNISAMICGNQNLNPKEYKNLEEAKEIITKFITEINDKKIK